MTTNRMFPRLAIALMLLAAACSRGPLQVTAIQTGRSLNSDNSVGNHATTFKPDQTIYVSVLTGNSGSSTLAARWYLRDRMIQETTKDVSYRGEAATEFHLQYAGNLPEGVYRVEILVDGEPAGSREIRVAY